MASYTGTSETSNKYGAQAASTASEMASDIGSSVNRTMDNASESISRSSHDAAQNAQAVAGNLRAAVDKSIQEQPMTTLVMAAAAGFLIGALWRS